MASTPTSVAAVLMLAAAIHRPAAVHAQPAVPGNIAAPAGAEAFLSLHAEGTQNHVCTVGPSGFAWTFFGPQATLFGDEGQQVTTHMLSANPDEDGAARATWQHSTDTSRVWAAAMASSSDPAFVAQGAIPWLLLRVVGEEAGPTGGSALGGTRFIQRIETAGGMAPAVGCKEAADIGKKALVPYEARYIFFR
jgi:hypothetical protein